MLGAVRLSPAHVTLVTHVSVRAVSVVMTVSVVCSVTVTVRAQSHEPTGGDLSRETLGGGAP